MRQKYGTKFYPLPPSRHYGGYGQRRSAAGVLLGRKQYLRQRGRGKLPPEGKNVCGRICEWAKVFAISHVQDNVPKIRNIFVERGSMLLAAHVDIYVTLNTLKIEIWCNSLSEEYCRVYNIEKVKDRLRDPTSARIVKFT